MSYANVYAGGVVGRIESSTGSISNSYSYGSVSASSTKYVVLVGGVAGISGYDNNTVGPITNSYCITNTSYSYWKASNTSNSSSTIGRVAAATLKGYASTLGSNNWVADSYSINSGYPILRWQVPSFDLNVKQTYMNVGDTLQLTADTSKSSVTLGSMTWTSYDTSIATVDGNGKVTAVGEGYTTIYATENKYALKAMCIVNVSKSGAIAFAQVEMISNYFTMVLKEDGTVWTVGNNTFGQLGDGTNVSKTEPVQVKINQYTPLTNVVKISIGARHCTALTRDGYVYAWGNNTYGQLGVNSTTNQSYAVKVLGPGGENYLSNIVDIANGYWYSHAVGADGNVYSWGRNDEAGQLGIGNTTNQIVPQIALSSNAISIDADYASTSMLTQNGVIWSWGMRRRWKAYVRNQSGFYKYANYNGVK